MIDTDALSITGNGKLDLTDNDMIVDYSGASQLGAVQALVTTGRNNGAWNGAGVTSSTAAANAQHNTGPGVIEASDYQSVFGAGATFDGRVTFDDYTKIDTGFNQHLTGWFNGDFNYSGGVTFDDYVLIDTAFNTQAGTLARQPALGARGGAARR